MLLLMEDTLKTTAYRLPPKYTLTKYIHFLFFVWTPSSTLFLSSVINFVEQAVTYENESDKLLVQTAKNTSLLPLSAPAMISSVALFEQDSFFRFLFVIHL